MSHQPRSGPAVFRPSLVRTKVLKPARTVRFIACCLLGGFSLPLTVVPLQAQTTAAMPAAGTGTIQGRVINSSSGNYLNNARITVPGTSLETNTDATGFFRLTNVPAGETKVLVSYVGLDSQSATVSVTAKTVTTQDFSIQLSESARLQDKDKVLELDVYRVTEKQLSGRASALQEQKYAPNIKNVVSFDEFGQMGEGNVAEYLKFVPGLDISYSPQVPLYMSIRGMPASGTLVTIDGAVGAGTGPAVSRQFDFSTSGTTNIDRVEVTKTPTPDLPANAVGGSINIITKSGFSLPKPSLKYNLFYTDDELEGIAHYSPSLGKTAGPDALTTKRAIQPSFNLAYIRPINDKFAFTLTGAYAARQMDWRYFTPGWDRVKLIQTRNAVNTVSVFRTNKSASGSLDWRLSPDDLITFTAQTSHQVSYVRSNTFTVNLGAGVTGDSTYSQGAATGVGTLARGYGANTQDKISDSGGIRYKHNGEVWKMDALLNFARGTYDSTPRGGYFTSITNTNSLSGNLIIRMDNLTGIEDMKNPVYSATNRAGTPVDIYRGDTLSMTAAGQVYNQRDHEVTTGGFNLERVLDFKVPTTIKMGVLIDSQSRYSAGDNLSYSYNPPGGTAARNLAAYDAYSTEYSNRVLMVDANGSPQKVQHLDTQKIYNNIYLQHPDWFTLNETSRYINWVNNRQDLEETISAAYIRGDVRLLENRLWLIGGVRYEHTNDKGAGPKNDISAIYVKNADGTLARTPGGALIPITTNAYEQAKLRYTELGTVAKKSYDGFYPSLNASYEIRDNLIMRAAYARTIGRPELDEIIPGSSISDPDSTSRSITVNNTALNPWTANNYDLTLEAYDIRGVTASVSLFQKDVTGFFADETELATQARVESLGLTWEDYYSTYDLVTRRNAGSASVKGIELSYRQSLDFLPGWGKNFQVFANFTTLTASGPDAESFSYSPQRMNWGIGYYGKKFSVNLNVADGKPTRTAARAANASTPASTYRYTQEYPRYDISAEYNFTRRLGIYASVRNLTSEPQRKYEYSPETPGYARPQQYLYSGAQIAVGLKGEW